MFIPDLLVLSHSIHVKKNQLCICAFHFPPLEIHKCVFFKQLQKIYSKKVWRKKKAHSSNKDMGFCSPFNIILHFEKLMVSRIAPFG